MVLVQLLLPGREPVVLLCEDVDPDPELPGRLVVQGPRDFVLEHGGRSFSVQRWRGVLPEAVGWVAEVATVEAGGR